MRDVGGGDQYWRTALHNGIRADAKLAPNLVSCSQRRRIAHARPLTVFVHQTPDSKRAAVEAFLEAAYDRAFKAQIRCHYPLLMSLQEERGATQAAVGFRFASGGPLFLEQYLDQPIELVLAKHFGQVARCGVVEIGNLAARSPAASRQLFLALARRLSFWGATHAVVTATYQLQRTFERLGLEPWRLSRAEPTRLGDDAADWGAYYRCDPVVLAQPIAPCLAMFASAVPETAQ